MKLIIRKASVSWKGRAKGGIQTVTTDSGVLKRTRFSLGLPTNNFPGTDPVELIAAAYASSFSLALSHELHVKPSAKGGITTVATVTLQHLATGWRILNMHLTVVATLPGVTQGRFIDATVRAKTNCLVSRLLRANVSMNAKLER